MFTLSSHTQAGTSPGSGFLPHCLQPAQESVAVVAGPRIVLRALKAYPRRASERTPMPPPPPPPRASESLSAGNNARNACSDSGSSSSHPSQPPPSSLYLLFFNLPDVKSCKEHGEFQESHGEEETHNGQTLEESAINARAKPTIIPPLHGPLNLVILESESQSDNKEATHVSHKWLWIRQ